MKNTTKNIDEEKDVKKNKDYTTQKVDLEEFNKKSVSDQFKAIEDILTQAYDKDTKILKSWILSCIEVTCSNKDDLIYLPCNLCVEKNKNIVTFSYKKRSKVSIFLLILYLAIFALGILAATYWAVFYLSRAELNKDIDGDGIADINLDLNDDGLAEINIDTNRDDKPDINIDYKGNRMSVFNIDTDNDGKPDFNMVHDATNGKKCELNCDTNGDGWPDLNIDIDGDGKADFDIDLDGDGTPDLNLDTTGDGRCNIMCDTDGDLVCDRSCIDTNIKDTTRRPGSTSITGNPENDITTGGLVITYENNDRASTGILPNDMLYHQEIPTRTFTIENTSAYAINYRLVWKVTTNDFETDHLEYRLNSIDNTYKSDWKAVPKKDELIQDGVYINARASRKYTLEFRFRGIYAEQNIDQGKTFNALVTAEYSDTIIYQ